MLARNYSSTMHPIKAGVRNNVLRFPRMQCLGRIIARREAGMLSATSSVSRKGIQPICTVAGECVFAYGFLCAGLIDAGGLRHHAP